MRWEEGIQEFGFDCKVRKLSPKTIENYSKQLRYPKAFSAASLPFMPIQNSAGRTFEKLDIRFEKEDMRTAQNPNKSRGFGRFYC